MRIWIAVTLAWCSMLTPSATAQEVDSPEEYLGRPVGTDFELADWDQVSGYYRQLAEQSPCVRLEKVGETTEGRDFLVAILSSPENLEQLEEIQQHARRLADPRGASPAELRRAVRRGKVILFITPTMHATEAAATEMGMELAWQLATSEDQPWRGARQNAVVVITPSLNPDGVDHVVHWYREHVDTPLESTSLLKLYQYYTGHDNNRDWFMLSQVETRHLTRLLYQQWFPHFLWDVHQQGNTKERFFVPPYRDPLNPNLDPAIVAGINLVGTRAAMDMTREGFTGIATGVSYDHWWNGGNRSVPTRHHVIGILTEAASVRIASPIFQTRDSLRDPLGTSRYQPSNQFLDPWPGGWWRLRDIIDYELAFGRSLLGSINREPRFWLSNALEASQRAIAAGEAGGPSAWLIPPQNQDRGAARRLVDVLLASGVEVQTATEDFTADDRSYPRGTILIRRDQPYGNYVKDLFELQEFPAGSPPYDVSGWTLPLLLGVHRVEVMHRLEADSELVEDAEAAVAAFQREAEEDQDRALWTGESDDWKALFARLQGGESFELVTRGDRAGWLIPESGEKSAEETEEVEEAEDADDAQGSEDEKADTDEEDRIAIEGMPRIGIYSPWSGNMDEGWLRWVFDEYEIPFITVRNEMLRAGRLEEMVDVLILPHVAARQLNRGRASGTVPDPYAGGLAPEGAVAVEAFVRGGGRLIAWGGAAPWVIDQLGLPLEEVTRESKEFSCPGSVLRAVVEPHRLTAGLDDESALFFSNSLAWRRGSAGGDDAVRSRWIGSVETLVRYAPSRVLWSGYIAEPEVIEGRSAWVTAGYGQGRVHLFGFQPHYRSWSQTTFPWLFRAVLLKP